MARPKRQQRGIGMPENVVGADKKYAPGMDAPPNAKGMKGDASEQATMEPRLTKAEERKIIELALKRFKMAFDAESDNRKEALDDLKFLKGDQWPDDIKQARASDKRPCLTINQLPTLTHQVSNDIRQNRPDIVISPMGDVADREAAKTFAGLIRAIQRQCEADIAYDTAVTSAVNIGFGYWMVVLEYESEKSFNQRAAIRRIRNPFRVYPDPERQEPDGSDMRYCFLTDMMTRAEYKERWPDADPLGWREKGIGDDLRLWIEKDSVRVAEYWTVESEYKRLVHLSNGHVGYYEDLDDSVKADIEDGTIEVLAERQAEVQTVMFRRITGLQVLEEKKWLGRWIPIVEVVGDELDVSGKVTRSGMVRHAKDPQRMLNYWSTSKTEFIALAPKSPWVGAEGQFEGHEYKWNNAHTKTFTTLEYVPISLDGHPVPPPQRQPMPGVPAGVVEAEQAAQQQIMATTGVRFNATAADRLYDESGLALKEIRRNVDIGSFHYTDNFCRGLRHTGRILIDLIPKAYDTRQVVTILREDDTEERVTLDPEQGSPIKRNQRASKDHLRLIFDPTVGEYGVTVTTGPSYATKRIEAVEQLMRFAQALPQQGALIAHLIAKYSDWPGADEAYRLLSRALPPQLQAPDMKDLPPQAASMIQSLMAQLRQLTVERMQMLKDLTDQRADRAVRLEKINKDFEAKLTTALISARTKMIDILGPDLAQMVQGVSDAAGIAQPGFATAGGPAPGAPQFQPNPAQLPVGPVQQPSLQQF